MESFTSYLTKGRVALAAVGMLTALAGTTAISSDAMARDGHRDRGDRHGHYDRGGHRGHGHGDWNRGHRHNSHWRDHHHHRHYSRPAYYYNDYYYRPAPRYYYPSYYDGYYAEPGISLGFVFR